MSKVAVVTGSNKGIGYAIIKGLLQRLQGAVYLTSRDEARGRAAVEDLNRLGLKPHYHQLDVTDRSSVIRFRDHVQQQHGGIDFLVNNAGIAYVQEDTYDRCKAVIDTNYYANLTVQELLFPLVRDHGRVLNISSDCGHLSNIRNKHWIERLSKKDLKLEDINEFVEWYLESIRNGTFNPADIADNGVAASYRVAKVALSALTIVQQREMVSRHVSVNSLHPGFVRTEMTGGAGFLDPEEAAATPLHLLLEAPPSLQGAYVWYDGRLQDWYDYKADWYFKSDTLYS